MGHSYPLHIPLHNQSFFLFWYGTYGKFSLIASCIWLWINNSFTSIQGILSFYHYLNTWQSYCTVSCIDIEYNLRYFCIFCYHTSSYWIRRCIYGLNHLSILTIMVGTVWPGSISLANALSFLVRPAWMIAFSFNTWTIFSFPILMLNMQSGQLEHHHLLQVKQQVIVGMKTCVVFMKNLPEDKHYILLLKLMFLTREQHLNWLVCKYNSTTSSIKKQGLEQYLGYVDNLIHTTLLFVPYFNIYHTFWIDNWKVNNQMSQEINGKMQTLLSDDLSCSCLSIYF